MCRELKDIQLHVMGFLLGGLLGVYLFPSVQDPTFQYRSGCEYDIVDWLVCSV